MGWGPIVTMQSWCNQPSRKKKQREIAKGKEEAMNDLPRALFLCNMASVFGRGLFSVERLLTARPYLKITILGLFDGNCDSP